MVKKKSGKKKKTSKKRNKNNFLFPSTGEIRVGDLEG